MGKTSSSTPKLYRRLIGGIGSNSRHRLWIGPDHLLLVTSSLFGERYKRFYFADIQALVMRRTLAYWWVALIWLGAAIFCTWLALIIKDLDAARWTFAIAGGMSLAFLLWHLIRGSTCTCHLRTAVQMERIHSLSRVRTARRFLSEVRPLIEAAQAPGRASAPETFAPAPTS